ncbi:MAG: glycosyltransferase [Flavobacteriales bacterium]|nr:glycosyltransferase [Flavobacteriales bacterium]
MPVFNAAPFLYDCLSSIQAQSYSHWELIAVNDFSTDESKQILIDFAQKDERIQILNNRAKGIIPALRVAYTESKGAYITRMDADDLMFTHKLESLLAITEHRTIATGKVKYFRDLEDLGAGYARYADWLNMLIDTGSHWNSIYQECVIPSPAWMITRRTLESIGAFDSHRYPEDYDLVFRCYEAGLEVRTTPDIIHSWRDHPQRASRNDPNYKDNRFLDIKLKYFMEIDFEPERPLVLWGAGKKGKSIAKYFVDHTVEFIWITENQKKLQAPIYGKKLQGIDSIPQGSNCIISVAGPEDQEHIGLKLAQRKGVKSYWFC